MDEEAGSYGHGLRDTSRLEAFSDGVIAIAITLLILEVTIPHLNTTSQGRTLWSDLADLWPSFLGYVLSFVIIGFLWIQHHELFKLIISVDRTLLVLNIALLLTIAFMPFPTALVSEYIGHEGENIAKLIYSGWILVIAIIFNSMWRYAKSTHRRLVAVGDGESVSRMSKRLNRWSLLCLVSFLISVATY